MGGIERDEIPGSLWGVGGHGKKVTGQGSRGRRGNLLRIAVKGGTLERGGGRVPYKWLRCMPFAAVCFCVAAYIPCVAAYRPSGSHAMASCLAGLSPALSNLLSAVLSTVAACRRSHLAGLPSLLLGLSANDYALSNSEHCCPRLLSAAAAYLQVGPYCWPP
jgi:hypothetical protein